MIILGSIFILVGAILILTVSIPCAMDIHSCINRLTKPYAFDYVSWELNALSSLPDILLNADTDEKPAVKISNEMRTVLKDNGIGPFPPVLIEIEKPPNLLVVSPKDKIAYTDSFLLSQHLDVKEMERIESKVDSLGLSSIVVELGGFGAVYPPVVSDNIR